MELNDNKLLEMLLVDFSDTKIQSTSKDLWKSLRDMNTEIWLDTGDIDAIDQLWSSDMSALTTNNTLLNNEIQKGIYDTTVTILNNKLPVDLDIDRRIIEIAFYLNALHGMRLSRRYGCKVSVELHTDFADDVDEIVNYGKRFFKIAPENFIIKVPYTASGLLGARKLHDLNIPVNFTLMFSARQNVLAALIAQSAYSNVFLGRIQAYNDTHQLNGPKDLSEQVIYSTEFELRKLRQDNLSRTHLIAASMRQDSQIATLSGTDVYTIPPAVATKGLETLKIPLDSHMPENFIFSPSNDLKHSTSVLNKVWQLPEKLLNLTISISKNIPQDPEQLVNIYNNEGYPDLFPLLSDKELKQISTDGKIPVHSKWKDHIAEGSLAIDTLLTLGGLASFKNDQAELDNRIKRLIT